MSGPVKGRSIGVDGSGSVGHAGFSNVDHNRGELFDLDDQIDLKIAYLDALLEKSPASRFILMGHSVGSYMVQQRVRCNVTLLSITTM